MFQGKKAVVKVSLLVLAILIIGFLAVYASGVLGTEGISVSTDKADYSPEEIVYISGSGFSAASDSNPVQIKVTRPTLPTPTIDTCPITNVCGPLPTTSSFSDYEYKLDGITGAYIIDASDGENSASASFSDDQPVFFIKILQPANLSAVVGLVNVSGVWNVTSPPGNDPNAYNIQINWGDGSSDNIININRNDNGLSGSNQIFYGTFDTYPGFTHNYTTCGNFNVIVKLYHGQPPGNEAGDAQDTINIYACSQPIVCGNKILEQGEQCERKQDNSWDPCCDSSTCQFKLSSNVCRASAGVCDTAETCTGSSATCPSDSKSTAQCREASGVCDVAENCDGQNNDCPVDAFAQTGTSCSDGLFCNGAETCNAGVCVPSTVPCAYYINACTDVSCNEGTDQCVETPIPSCCLTASDCTQGPTCSTASCVDHTCQYTPGDDGQGPVTSDLTAKQVPGLCQINIEALETDICSNIAAAEYFLQTCGFVGTGMPMDPKDGSFNSLIEAVIKNSVNSGIADGRLIVYVRGKDANAKGNWGACKAVGVDMDCIAPYYPTCEIGNTIPSQGPKGIDLNGKCNAQEELVCGNNPIIKANICDGESRIQLAEYFIDEDCKNNPSACIDWQGINMTVSDGSWNESCEDIQAEVNISSLSEGTHYIQLHGKDGKENWGKFILAPEISFIKDTTAPSTSKKLNPAGDVSVACDIENADGKTITDGCAYVKAGTTIDLSAEDFKPNDLEYAGNVVIHYKVYIGDDCDSNDPEDWSVSQEGTGNKITLNEDSCHLIEYWASDGCNNNENKHYELDIVDTKAPETEKKITGPKIAGDGNPIHYYLTDDSTITLTCTDQQPHPVDAVKIHYKIDWKLNSEDPWQEGQWAEDGNEVVITYVKDSYHRLTYYCEDALGNKETEQVEIDAVDTQGPKIEKTIGDPKVWKNEEWYITQNTEICISATDPQPHPVDNVQLSCEYWLNEQTGKGTPIELDENGCFKFPTDSHHILHCEATDALGNKAEDLWECDTVDTVPPVSEKTVGEPKVVKEDETYITQQTPITLTCLDQQPHPVGGESIFYRYRVAEECSDLNSATFGDWMPASSSTVKASSSSMSFSSTGWGGWSCPQGTVVVDGGYEPDPANNPVAHSLAWKPGACVDSVCWPNTPFGYTYHEGETGWIVQNGGVPQSLSVYAICADPITFTFPEDSCHELEWYCKDALGNKEETQSEIDIVDTEAPIVNKQVGEPKVLINPQCNPAQGTCDYHVTPETDITFTCNDANPHPVGGEKLCYKVNWDKEGDVTQLYCGEQDLENGYCCVDAQDSFIFNFKNEYSNHTIDYYCKDALGNAGNVETELDSVDTKGPWIIIHNPSIIEALTGIKRCDQSVVVEVWDEKSGVNESSVYAQLYYENGTAVPNHIIKLTKVDNQIGLLGGKMFEGIMDKQLPAGEYTLRAFASDNLGNKGEAERNETLAEGLYVEFLDPASCPVNFGENKTCKFTFHVCARDVTTIDMCMYKLGTDPGLITPYGLNAMISKGNNSAYVGLCNVSVGDPKDLELGGKINGKTTFDLTMDFNSNITTILGTGNYKLNYTINFWDP